jgi:hypothetical protein
LNQEIGVLNAAAAAPYLTGTPTTYGHRYEGYLEYKPGDWATGLWFKGEYAWIKDSTANVPGTTGLFDPAGNGPPTFYQPFVTEGYYASVGYDLGAAKGDWIPCWAKNFEFDARYQRYSNVWMQSEGNPNEVLTFFTKQETLGVNYAIKGHHNAKIQANYDFIQNPTGNASYHFHQVQNDVFSMNFQVMW